jgi:CBS domain containing-hemolysin-like protein
MEDFIMITLLSSLVEFTAFVPTFLAVFAVAVFTKETKSLCYITILLAVLTELIPSPAGINTTALLACTFCLGALLLVDILQASHAIKPVIRFSSHGVK